MQTRRLTITLRRASRRAPVARLTVTIAGSSCGVRPTAIASANRADWSSERPRATLMTKIEPASITVTVASSRENACSPCWNDVCPCRSPRRSAIAPKAVREPVRTTSAAPVAAAHERPHERARRQVERRVAGRVRVGRLGRDLRLAGQHGLVALELVDLEQAQVGRDDVADAQMHDVARHDLGDVDLGRLPVAIDEGEVADLRVQRLDGLLRAVLVEEAQADAHRA